MKSMKLASGFAVSALALAIAGQTVAQETTTDWSFEGAMGVEGMFDLENEARTNQFRDDNDVGDWAYLNATLGVANGPFSGDLELEADAGGNSSLSVDNLIVEDGPISFGQVGSVVATDDLIDTLTDEENEGMGADVSAAFRYTMSDLGLKVQAEGDDTNDFGVAAGIEQDVDVATVYADAQYREPTGGNTDTAYTVFGAGAEATPVEMLSLTAAFQSKSSDYVAGDNQSGGSTYGARADVTLTDAISAYAMYGEPNTEADDNEILYFGGEMGAGQLTVNADYETMMATVGEGTLTVKGTVTQAPYSAYAEVDQDLSADSEATGLTLGGDYGAESGIVYGADWELLNKGNIITAYAEYSF